MAVLINQKDCSKTIKNLGVPDCVVQNGRVTGFIAVSPSWSINIDTDTFTETLVNEWIQDGTFIPVLGAVEVPNGTPDDTTEEFQGGIMAVVRSGLPMFTFKFIKGWSYSRALYSMNSFQQYKLLLVFEDGSISGALNGATLSGYSLGMLNTGTFFHTDGNTSGFSNTIIQLTNANEYNLDTAVLDRSVIGFNANNLLPITDIYMSGRADVSDGKVYFKALFEMNRSNSLGGIAIANLRCTIDGVADTITALSLVYEPTTQEWEFEPTTTLTTAQSIVVQLYDSVNSVATAKIGQRFYKGVTPAITPVA